MSRFSTRFRSLLSIHSVFLRVQQYATVSTLISTQTTRPYRCNGSRLRLPVGYGRKKETPVCLCREWSPRRARSQGISPAKVARGCWLFDFALPFGFDPRREAQDAFKRSKNAVPYTRVQVGLLSTHVMFRFCCGVVLVEIPESIQHESLALSFDEC